MPFQYMPRQYMTRDTTRHDTSHALASSSGMVGGAWSCPVGIDEVVASVPEAAAAMGDLAVNYNLIVRTGYVMGELACPASCASDVGFEDCHCSCADANNTEIQVRSEEEGTGGGVRVVVRLYTVDDMAA